MNKRAQRNHGIDLLRIVCMIMVPLLHVLGHGGVLEATTPLTLHYEVAWLLEISAYCAVDCYALISGYVGYGSQHRFKGLISLCLQASFYILVVTLTAHILWPSTVELKDIFSILVPFRGTYWYLKSYFCLYFLMPYLDSLVESLNEIKLRKYLTVLLLIFSFLPMLIASDLPTTVSGYSLIWIAALYTIGAIIKKNKLDSLWVNSCNLIAYFIFVVTTWTLKYGIECATKFVTGSVMGGGLVVSYTSPTILACAIALLLYFSHLELHHTVITIVSFLAPLSFGVYLLHEEPVLKSIIDGRFSYLAELRPLLMCSSAVAIALGIWLFGSLVDWVRTRAFSLLRVDELSESVGRNIDKLLLMLE